MSPGLEVSGSDQLHPPWPRPGVPPRCQHRITVPRMFQMPGPHQTFMTAGNYRYNYVKEVLPLQVHIKHNEINMMANF